MPIYQTKIISDTVKLGVWKITEPEETLVDLYIKNRGIPADIPKTRNKQRIKQWLATRILLQSFFNHVNIVYDDFGKPLLDNDWNISISHSNEFAAIILNKENSCGIDIEKITSKIERIKKKFLNPNDIKKIRSQEHLTLYWASKEALYKYYGKKEVIFIDHLFIEDFSPNKTLFFGKIEMPNLKKKIRMSWEKIDDFVLIYTL